MDLYTSVDCSNDQPVIPHFTKSWDQDFRERTNPELFTQLLQDAIPVAKYVNFQIVEVSEGYCRSLLPLNFQSTNQHGSHQAALMSLAADYTGGVAFATLLRGVPIGGVHPGNDERTAALWLASMTVKYLMPSAGDLSITCRIDGKECRNIQRRYFSGRRVLSRLNIEFSSEGEQVATAEMAYFAQPSSQLKPTRENPRISTLFKHRIKASARMIAGLRAGLGGRSQLKLHCPHSKVVAGPHGKLLAKRLNGILPQLQDMVLARTKHLDGVVINALKCGLKQVVLIGAGLDVRAYRHGLESLKATYFEVDLPEMLEERERVLRKLHGPALKRKAVPMNFETQRLDRVLETTKGFDPSLPTAFIYEGCTMYFDERTNRDMLLAARKVMRHPDSFIWVDYVADSVVTGEFEHAAVQAFLRGMDELGESFVFGTDDPSGFMRELGFETVEVRNSSDFFETTDPVCSLYRFTVSRRAT